MNASVQFGRGKNEQFSAHTEVLMSLQANDAAQKRSYEHGMMHVPLRIQVYGWSEWKSGSAPFGSS